MSQNRMLTNATSAMPAAQKVVFPSALLALAIHPPVAAESV
jgi:hypothetical protein